MRISTRLALLSFAWPSALAAAQDSLQAVEIKSTRVAGPVYMLEGRGGNIGVSAGEDGLLMIDDQFAPLAEKIAAALKTISETGQLKFVLNTHWHGDHTGGNAFFGRTATIIAHENVRTRLTTKQTLFGGEIEPLPKSGWPVITFDESLTIHFNGEPIQVLHLARSHTDGDSVILFKKSNVVHMGDNFFSGMFPFVDVDSGGSVEGMTRNVARMLEELPADVKIIPGHGPLSTVAELKEFHRMLVATTDVVRQRVKAGQDLAAIQAEGLPEEWAPWGAGFIDTKRWIEIVVRSLEKDANG